MLEKVFFIIHSGVSISYSFRRSYDNPDQPARKNWAYDKLSKGDLTLSPYTQWRFRLIDVGKQNYTNLEKFKDQVSIILTGEGSYILKEDAKELDPSECQNNLYS